MTGTDPRSGPDPDPYDGTRETGVPKSPDTYSVTVDPTNYYCRCGPFDQDRGREGKRKERSWSWTVLSVLPLPVGEDSLECSFLLGICW